MPTDRDGLRTLRKRLLIARSALLRERLAREWHRSTQPAHLLREALGFGGALPPGRILLTLLPWMLGRWRRRRRAP
jgi:hypothetical protein